MISESKKNGTRKTAKVEKCKNVLSTYDDWFFMQDFLNSDMIKELNIYVYHKVDNWTHYDYIATRPEADKIAELIINSFAHSSIPKIEVVDGNGKESGELLLVHSHAGVDLNRIYTEKTMQHIWNLWKKTIHLKTKHKNKVIFYTVDDKHLMKNDRITASLKDALKRLNS